MSIARSVHAIIARALSSPTDSAVTSNAAGMPRRAKPPFRPLAPSATAAPVVEPDALAGLGEPERRGAAGDAAADDNDVRIVDVGLRTRWRRLAEPVRRHRGDPRGCWTAASRAEDVGSTEARWHLRQRRRSPAPRAGSLTRPSPPQASPRRSPPRSPGSARPGSDFAAHLYQSGLFEDHGFAIWNNFWYAGRYSFVTYSLLYYPLAALFGIKLLAVASIATAALAFGVVASREWGPASRWSNRSFAVVWAGVVLSGAFPFALGIALALLALWALQAGRRGRFALLTVLVLTASPVAFVLLAVILAGIGLSRAPRRSELVLPLTTLGLAAAVELVLLRLFPAGGRFPFSLPEFAAACVFCGLGIVLTWRVAAAGVLRWMYVAYLVACTAAYLVPSSLGENIARLRYAAIPIAILTLSLRRWRPLPVALFALTLAVAWNLTPLAGSFVKTSADPAANAAYWAPAVGFLRENLSPSYRVEAVDTVGHWPAAYLPAAGIPIARGWFRQDDFPRNDLLYAKLDRDTLRRVAPIARRALRRAARRAARLQRQGGGRADRRRDLQPRPGVPLGAHDDLRRAVTAPHRDRAGPRRGARCSGSTGSRSSVARPGRYRIATNWSPYWTTGAGCLSRGDDGTVRLTTTRAGIVRLDLSVNARGALVALEGGSKPQCAR